MANDATSRTWSREQRTQDLLKNLTSHGHNEEYEFWMLMGTRWLAGYPEVREALKDLIDLDALEARKKALLAAPTLAREA